MALFYTMDVTDRESGNYSHMTIDVLEGELETLRHSVELDLSYRWQAARTAVYGLVRLHGLYAPHVQPDNISNALRVAKRIARKVGPSYGWGLSPAAIIEALEALKARRVVLDERIDKYLLIEDVAPADYDAWADNWRAYGRHTTYKKVLARDEDEAKAGILRAFSEKIVKYPWDTMLATRLADWLQAGQPVVNLTKARAYYNWYKPPVTTPTEDLIALGGTEQDIEIEDGETEAA